MSKHTLQSGDITRTYYVYVPQSYSGTQLVPLVISLHGFASNATQQADYSGWNVLAESQHFIAVYPEGTGSPPRWNAGQTEIPGAQPEYRGPLAQLLGGFFETVPADDVGFIRDLIAVLQADNCIDAARIYVNGMSNGGGMTNRLACELADQVAAVGMVAGAYTEFPGGCHPARPIPVMAFHGTDDPIVPYDGNERIHFPAIEQWAADWAARDSCNPAPEAVAGTVGDVSGVRYGDCAEGAEVVFYTIDGGGHTWPGSDPLLPFLLGETSQDVDASATLWQFFEAHPLQ